MTEKIPETVPLKSEGRKPAVVKVDIEVGCESLDVATKKANRLVELLQEAQQIISSLSTRKTCK